MIAGHIRSLSRLLLALGRARYVTPAQRPGIRDENRGVVTRWSVTGGSGVAVAGPDISDNRPPAGIDRLVLGRDLLPTPTMVPVQAPPLDARKSRAA